MKAHAVSIAMILFTKRYATQKNKVWKKKAELSTIIIDEHAVRTYAFNI